MIISVFFAGQCDVAAFKECYKETQGLTTLVCKYLL